MVVPELGCGRSPEKDDGIEEAAVDLGELDVGADDGAG